MKETSIAGLWLLSALTVQAEIIASGFDTIISGKSVFLVSGGTEKGSNLFHRYEEFSLTGGEKVKFVNDNSQPISNIINLVSGSGKSIINGDIDTSEFSGSHFYLLNPNGVMFGKDATLNRDAKVDILGSFYVSTADYLKTGNQKIGVDASAGLLSSAAPESFGFLSSTPETVTIAASGEGLNVRGGDFVVAAGNIKFMHGELSVRGGNVHLSTQVNSQNESVFITKENSPVGLHYLGDIILEDDSDIKARAVDAVGGSIDLRAQNISLGSQDEGSQPSRIFADTRSNASAALRLTASRDIILYSGDRIVAKRRGAELRNIDLITIMEFRSLSVLDGSEIVTRETGDNRRAGDIKIESPGSTVTLGDGSEIDTSGAGDASLAGDIVLSMRELSLTKNAQIQATTTGNSADLALQAGDIIVSSKKITIKNGQIINQNSGTGVGGIIDIKDNNLLEISGENGGIISSTTGSGAGGTIKIQSDAVNLATGGHIIAESTGSGISGDVDITTNQLEVFDLGSRIDVNTEGADAGLIKIKSSGLVHLDHQGEITTSSNNGFGDGGEINITGIGKRNLVLLNRRSKIFANTAAGTGGNVVFNVQSVTKSADSEIKAEAKEPTGIDGNIEFNTPDVDATTGALELPETYFDASPLIGNRCVTETTVNSTFYVAERDGLAASPDLLLSGYSGYDDRDALVNGEPSQVAAPINSQFMNSPTKIICMR